jgi:integrase
MSLSYDVTVWGIVRRADRGRSYRVRWSVGRRRFERGFSTKQLADAFRSDLLKASRSGQGFERSNGLPQSMARAGNPLTWYEHAKSYAQMKWPSAAAKTRRSTAEALTTVTVALVANRKGGPSLEDLRSALYGWAFNPSTWGSPAPERVAEALQWLESVSVPVVELAKPAMIREALDACAKRLDGRPAAATTVRRKRAVLYNALGYAVEREILDFNPIDKVQWRAPDTASTVDRRVVANTAQVEAILAEAKSFGGSAARLVAFFGCLYYAGMRPSEASSLRRSDCWLPRSGWGRLVLSESAPRAGASWTNDGQVRENRGLKRRGEGETRPVPIPPELVQLLNNHIDTYRIGPSDRLFVGARGGDLSDSVYDRAWKKARARAFPDDLVASPLARRPYDLRHAAVSLWLNGGVPATEVARRVGHSVAVLLTVYANCIDGQEEVVNDRIGAALEQGRSVGASWGSHPDRPAASDESAGQA